MPRRPAPAPPRGPRAAIEAAWLALGRARPGAEGEAIRRDLWRIVALKAARARGLLAEGPVEGAGRALGGLFAPPPEGPLPEAALAALDGVDWAGLAPEALGEAYEALLAREGVEQDGAFVLREGAGRKAAGGFYTPAPLVERLLDEALEPLLDRGQPLELRLLDPACGTGHFLVAAARRIAARAGPDSLGAVVGRCLFGVELDPLALELCRFVLWLEVADPTRGLDTCGQLRRGDALLGAPARIEGIPDEAWPATGPEGKAGRALRRRNATERAVATDRAPTDPALAADAWCAAFFWPVAEAASAPTDACWRRLGEVGTEATRAGVAALRERHAFFHWSLAFPEVLGGEAAPAEGAPAREGPGPLFAGPRPPARRGPPGFDLVIGNPPYLNQLESQSAVADGARRLLRARFGACKQAYTDLATLFLVRAMELLRPGGRQALVHPLSFFAAQDAAPARALLAGEATLRQLWTTPEHYFGASVHVAATVLEKGGPRRVELGRRVGSAFVPAPPRPIDMDALAAEPTWGPLVADLFGVPDAPLRGRPLGERASATADFRDQFYGLAPFVVEDRPGLDPRRFPRLVVTGLVEPAACLWGGRGCRFAGRAWQRPRVDLAALEAEGSLAAWARGRLVPKLVVATQTRVLEAFVDEDGSLLNTVPTLSLMPHRAEDHWRLLAALLSPPASAWAAGRYAGTALSSTAIKLSAEQLLALPLPEPGPAWEAAAALVRAAQQEGEATRRAKLVEAGGLMCAAWGLAREPLLGWWEGRL